MLALCSGEFMNACWMAVALGPMPTFSPKSVHPAGRNGTTLGLCDRAPLASSTLDQPSAMAVSVGSMASGGRPAAARALLVNWANWASTPASAADADDDERPSTRGPAIMTMAKTATIQDVMRFIGSPPALGADPHRHVRSFGAPSPPLEGYSRQWQEWTSPRGRGPGPRR